MERSIHHLFDLHEHVAVITGGSGALGSAMAHGLARAGARIVVLARTLSNAEDVAQQIEDEGGEAMAISTDVLAEDQLRQARAAILERWGRIDILINAAGGNVEKATLSPGKTVFDLPQEAFRRVFDLNLMGTLLPTQIFGETMAEQRRGSIINVSSMVADRAITRVIGYSAAKAAVENLTHWLAMELARRYGAGLRVNAIAPGFFIGEQNRRLLLNEDESLTDRGRTIIAHTPMGRFGEAEEVISTVHWLSCNASRFVTGVVIPIDGGFSAFSGA